MHSELNVQISELRGSYHQLGLLQGQELDASAFQNMLPLYQEMCKKTEADKVKLALKSYAPALLDEISGLATALNMDEFEALKYFGGYDISLPPMGCTTYINNGLYVRNYDFSPVLYDARLVILQPEQGLASIGFSQHLTGRLDGMNEAGLVIGLHFVNNKEQHRGFLATMIVRLVLERCTTTAEAIQFITSLPHSYAYNFSLTDKTNHSVMIEATPMQQVVQQTVPVACTNHFVSDALSAANREHIQDSVKRKQYLEQLEEIPLSAKEAYQHFNASTSPLFYTKYKQLFGTLHTVVYSPQDLQVHVGVGENCPPVSISFGEWLVNDIELPQVIRGMINDV